MATSGSFTTSSISDGSRSWYWEFSWTSSYSGNTATINWDIYVRCNSGTSGQTWVTNYGFGGYVHTTDLSFEESRYYKDARVANGTFTYEGGKTFGVVIWAKAYSSSNQVDGSQDFTLDNAITNPTVTASVLSRDLTTIGASMSVTNDGGAPIVARYIELFTDSSCNNKVGTITGASGTFTGLTQNTTYYVRAKAGNGTYVGYSTVLTTSTQSKATISSASDITHGSSLTVTYNNPSGASLKIGFNTTGGTVICAERTCTGSSYTFNFTDAELDRMYKQYGNSSTLSAYVILRTANTYYDTKTITVTLKGNQKTVHDKISGNWLRGKIWTKVSGTWRQGVIWTNVSGTWRRGI